MIQQKSRVHVFLLTLLMFQSTHAQTTRVYSEPSLEPPEHQVDMKHMRLEVSFIPEEGLVKGTVTHIFTPLRKRVDSLFFNGPGIRISKATLNGSSVKFSISAEGITVFFPTPLLWDEADSVSLVYEATPRQGMYFIGWNDPTNRSRKQIWTQGQGIDNRYWFPCCDLQNDKLTTEVIVRFDTAYKVLSNGARLDVQNNGDGTTTWHYRMSHPHSTYLVMLVIGKYGIEQRMTRRGLPVNLYYYPDQEDRVEPTYRYSVEAIEFMENHTGFPFPWESYSQIPVQDFLYGAMENTTATVFGDFLMVDRRSFFDRNYIYVNVHELAHQWFGDLITARSGRDSWLQESFATFYPKLFLRSVFGEDYYQWNRRTEQNGALAASEKDEFPIVHSRAGSDRVYSKGSAVLDMAVYTWGEDAYRRVITHYLQKHAYQNVETNDLYQAFQDVLGITPWWFFDQWIDRGGEPHYRITYQNVSLEGRRGRQTQITVEQIHQTDDLIKLFRMPIVFQVHYADGSADSVRQMVEGQTERVVVPNPESKRISFVLFDPGGYILKKVTFAKSFDELRAQALRAPLMIDRFDAVAAMRPLPLITKRATLIEVFGRETFHAIRSEITSQLLQDPDPSSKTVIVAALHDKSSEVRRTNLGEMPIIPENMRPQAEALLRDSSYTTVGMALSKLSAEFPDRIPEYLGITRADKGTGDEVRVLWHEIRAHQGDRSSLDTLVDMTGISFEFRTRVNAFASLKRLSYVNAQLIENLFQAMTHANGRLRGPATETVQYFCQQAALAPLFQEYYHRHHWEPWQATILEKAFR